MLNFGYGKDNGKYAKKMGDFAQQKANEAQQKTEELETVIDENRFNFKGDVPTRSAIPSSKEFGDAWFVIDEGATVRWNGTALELRNTNNPSQIQNLTAQLADKVGGQRKLKPEEFSDEAMALVTGNGTVNVLSIPQEESVTPSTLAPSLKSVFLIENKNLYNPALAVDGKLTNYGNGAYVDFATSAMSGKQAVNPNESLTYTFSMPNTENGFDAVFRCYNASGVFIGNSKVWNASPVASGISNTNVVNSNGRKQSTITLDPSTLVRFVETAIIFPYATHTTADFDRIRNSIQLEVGTAFTSFAPYGEKVVVSDEGMPNSYNEIQSNVNHAITKLRTLDKLVVIKQGDKIGIRSDYDDTYDFLHVWQYPSPTNQNLGLNLIAMHLVDKTASENTMVGANFKSCADDITPLNANGSYVGGNHGYSFVYDITANAHGKTTLDIGSVWAIGTDNFLILDILDINKIRVMSDYTGDPLFPARTLASSGTFTHVSGATNTSAITFASQVRTQLWPSTNKKSVKLMLDGKELSEDGVYYGEKCDIAETYNIVDVPDYQQFVKENVGVKVLPNDENLEGWVTVTNIFTHGRNSSMTVKTAYEYLKPTSLSFFGVVQSISVGDKAYVPDVGVVAGLNLSNVVTQPSGTYLGFTKSSWLNPDKAPYRYHQFNSDLSKGMALGYNRSIGLGKNEIRKLISDAGNFAGSSRKMYPVIKNTQTVGKGDYHDAVAFRVPLRKIDPEATALYWYWVGNDVYLAFDYHVNIDKIIELPSYLAGKKIEQLDIHPNTTVQSEFVSSKGIKVKVVNNYGYGVLRLYD